MPAMRFPKMSDLAIELIKRLGSTPLINRITGSDPVEPDDYPYLEQFFGKERLHPTSLRPQSLTMKDKLPWYGPDFWKVEANLPSLTKDIDKLQPSEVISLGDLPLQPAFGGVVQSIGKDMEGPYASMYDKWDFDSPVINPLIGALLNRVGQPFHIYGRKRLSKNPVTGEYKPEEYHNDIELPSK